MDFTDAVAYLDQHVNLEANAGWVHGLSLDNMRAVVDLLGDPQAAYPVIHVTGTNGKGSTVRMIEALLAAHGLTVGSYTSPHVESLRERISRNGEAIAEQDFAEIVAEIATLETVFGATLDKPASYFELLTAAALSYFAREAVDVAVVEVGLLGRYDATNVVDASVAVVTNIDKDHTDGSGDWAGAIAAEKAGIIKPASHVVLGPVENRLVDIFAAEGGSALWRRDTDFGIDSDLVAVGGHLVDLYTPHGKLEELFVPHHGAHQVDNLVLAVAAVEAFFTRPVDHAVAAEAMSGLRLPGRFEVLSRSPLVIIDVAHNPAGTATVAETFVDEFRAHGDLTLVIGMLTGRDVHDVLAPLLALKPRRVLCTAPESGRAREARDVAAAVTAGLVGTATEVRVVDHVGTAVEQGLSLTGASDALVVTGSTYTVGEARPALRRALS